MHVFLAVDYFYVERPVARGVSINMLIYLFKASTGGKETCSFHLITGQAMESRSMHRDRYQSQGNTANVISRQTQLMMHGDGQRTLRELAV